MPSGKSSKRKRRAASAAPPPPVRRPGQRAVRSASPRVLMIGGVVVAVIVIVIVVAVLAFGGGSSDSFKNEPLIGSIKTGLPQASYVDQLFKGIPQNGNVLGKTSAPVTMVEFIDLQCPYCQQFETEVVPDLLKNYVRQGKLKIELQPWAFIGPDSVRGQAAVLAAAKQSRGFNYAELLFANQVTENTGWLDDAMVAAAARSIPGLRVHVLLNERNSSAIKASQAKVDALAKSDNVTSTPALFVGKSGGQGKLVTLASPTDEQAVVAAIKAASN